MWVSLMEQFVRVFLKGSLAWLALGVTMGVAMAVHPVWTVYRQAHMHMMLLGFVTMMIYGVAYHVIPRFAGFPLYSRRAPVIHLWISNVGLALMVVGFGVVVLKFAEQNRPRGWSSHRWPSSMWKLSVS